MDVLWLTAGLGCDGETVSIAAATQPAPKEWMFGALPLPSLTCEVGDGSVPNERDRRR
jgi:hypothetical protein